jgi:hypothetical protein
MSVNFIKLGTLESISNDVWEDVLQSYVRTNAILEIRCIEMSDNDYYITFPETDKSNIDDPESYVSYIERFEILVKESQKNNNGEVSALCGTLKRYNNGVLTYETPVLMKWNKELFSWYSHIGDKSNKSLMIAMCGNVIGFTADVIENTFPPLYEFNRPDAPKTGSEYRKWLLKR